MEKLKNLKMYENFHLDEAWNDFLRGPRTEDATRDSYRSKGFSHSGTDNLGSKNPTDFVVFDGRKFFGEDLLFASLHDMGEIPRIEGDKLIIANPAWKD